MSTELNLALLALEAEQLLLDFEMPELTLLSGQLWMNLRIRATSQQ